MGQKWVKEAGEVTTERGAGTKMRSRIKNKGEGSL
jgi:hypothetical protein